MSKDMGMTGRLIGILAMALVLSGCAGVRDRVSNIASGGTDVRFEGERFRGRASGDRDDRLLFTSSVRNASRSVEGAIQAAEYEGTRYCIEMLGTSDISWEVGPDLPADQLYQENDTVTLRGRCVEP